MCGGRIAEHKKTGDVSSGAQDDIQKVTEAARKMVREWGMSDEIGFLRLTNDDNGQQLRIEKNYSEQTAEKIDQEVRRLADEAYADAGRLIDEHWDRVESIAQNLLEYETLSADDIARILEEKSPRESHDDDKRELTGTATASG